MVFAKVVRMLLFFFFSIMMMLTVMTNDVSGSAPPMSLFILFLSTVTLVYSFFSSSPLYFYSQSTIFLPDFSWFHILALLLLLFFFSFDLFGHNSLRYAIGGLAGGEDKDSFWRVVAHVRSFLSLYLLL